MLEKISPGKKSWISNGASKNLVPLAIIIAGILIAGALVYVKTGGFEEIAKTPQVLTSQQVAEKAMNYINQNLLQEGVTASLVNVVEENGLYKIRIKIENSEYDTYASKDGKLFFPNEGLDLDQNPAGEASGEVPKRDVPDVKLFVMSYCPYGLQAQKMFLPVYNLLKDKAGIGVYFVDYIMHEKQEIDENLNQYCIQKEQKEKYYDYLNCFVADGDSEKCLTQAGIDKGKIESCISATDKEFSVTSLYNDKSTWLNGSYPQFNVYKDLNDRYGVQGSPTVVINDTVVVTSKDYCPGGDIKCAVIPNFTRTPESFKEIICQAFTNPPSECSQALSNDAPSAGIGGGTGSSDDGTCD